MIGLVSCSPQLAHAAPARELYNSVVFRLSLAYAERYCTVVYALSAFHGLVELDTVLKPYDRKLGSKREREAWGMRVGSSLIERHGRRVAYLILAGAEYAQPLARELRTHDGYREGGWHGVAPSLIKTPLARMGLGDRLRWLAQRRPA